jgi:hypothetical protein
VATEERVGVRPAFGEAGDESVHVLLVECRLEAPDDAHALSPATDLVDFGDELGVKSIQRLSAHDDALRHDLQLMPEILHGDVELVHSLRDPAVSSIESSIDGAELLIDGIEPPIDAFEALIDGFEALVDGIEPPVDGIEALIDGLEALVDGLEALVDGLEALVDGIEPPVDASEALMHFGAKRVEVLA